jgi:signal transduction histidine kinase/CheY-like chemotaxis protein
MADPAVGFSQTEARAWSTLQVVPAPTAGRPDKNSRSVERRSVGRRTDDAITDAAFESLPRFWLGQAVLAAGFAGCARLMAVPANQSPGLHAVLAMAYSGVGLALLILMSASAVLAFAYANARVRLGAYRAVLRYKHHWRSALTMLLGILVLLPALLSLWPGLMQAVRSADLLFALSLVQLAQLALVLATLPMLAALAACAAAGLLLPAWAWLMLGSTGAGMGSAGLALLLCLPALAGVLQSRQAAKRWLAEVRQRLLDQDHVNALMAERDVARRSEEDKSRFVAAASHDLRQPMHALGLFVATLERRLAGEPEEPLVRNMMRAIEVLDRSFTAMLDISRLDAGTVRPHMQSFPLRDLFRRLHMQFVGQAESAGLALRFSPGGKSVSSDPQLLERVLGNLLQNALRYTRSGGVVVVARSRVDRLNIEIWDSGCGIAQTELPRIFDEFYRVSSPAGQENPEAAHGLGMGLAIVRRLIALLGHTLDVHSAPGKGTLFRIGIAQTAFTEIEAQTAAADTVPAPVFAARTVLVIDDEPAIREGLQMLLETWGFASATAANVAQARAVAASLGTELDLVISDLHLLRGEDGLQAIAAVREACGRVVPAMLVTGDVTPAEIRRAAASGNMVLFKPLQPSKLFSVLRTLVE